MKILWTPEAEQDRADIFDHITATNPRAAIRLDGLFSETAAKLSEFPMLGRVGAVAGTREVLPHESYRLIYEIDAGTLWVLALVHTVRRWPPLR